MKILTFPFMFLLALQPICFAQLLHNSEDTSYKQSVVMIRNVQQTNQVRTPWERNARRGGSGSGVVIEGNYILTNAHVVHDSKYLEIKKANNAKYYPAEVKYIGHDCDLALIAPLDPTFFLDMKPLPFGDIPVVNTQVQSYGFPLGLRGGHNIAVTRGIISRIEFKTYSHTGADQHLLIQTDAAINPGNSGGPAIQDGKIIGIVFQGMSSAAAESVGYMIPTTVIQHFLKDIQDKNYDGFPRLGIMHFNGLQSEALSDYLKVPKKTSGIVVTKVVELSPLYGKIQKNDVISKIDGIQIYNDGMVIVDGRRFQFNEIIDRKQIDEVAKFEIWRDGKMQSVEAKLNYFRYPFEYGRVHGEKFEYFMTGGLVFVNVNRNLIETWGGNWFLSLPVPLKKMYQFQYENKEIAKTKHFILLSKILPDSVNIRCDEYNNSLLNKVNGKLIYKLEDIQAAMKDNKDKFHTFEFLGHSKPLTLNVKEVEKNQKSIMEKYKVPAAHYFKKSS